MNNICGGNVDDVDDVFVPIRHIGSLPARGTDDAQRSGANFNYFFEARRLRVDDIEVFSSGLVATMIWLWS